MTDRYQKRTVIAIDGPAGSGKSTVSRLLAEKMNYVYIDTGAMYRAVAFAALRNGIDFADHNRLGHLCRSLNLRFANDWDPPRLFLDDEDISSVIRTPEMDMFSSKVSAVEAVRRAMVDLQREMAKGAHVVVEGRDMGTVVFPEAQHKFFITASPEIRAQRRHKERREKGETVTAAAVEEAMRQRDLQDSTRATAPLKPAKDAIVIDSTPFTVEQVLEEIVRFMGRK